MPYRSPDPLAREAQAEVEAEEAMNSAFSGATWLCEMITTRYFPELQLARAELALDVNYYFQSLGGLRQLPRQVSASDFNDRALTRVNDPQRLQFAWSLGRRAYWLVYDLAPKFWQQQFSDRTLLSGFAVDVIAAIVSANPQRTPASQKLIAFLHTSNRPLANH